MREEILASKHCILLTNLVGGINEKVLNNDKMGINCSICTFYLLEYESPEGDNLIKP